MQCTQIEPLLLRRLDGRLEGDEAVRLDRHVQGCAACRDALETQRWVAAALSARPDADVAPGFSARVMAGLEGAPSWLELMNWRLWTFRLAPVAAALLVVAALGFGPTEAAEPMEFSDLVAGWVADEETGTLPAFTVLWEDEVTGETLLEAVLTAGASDATP